MIRSRLAPLLLAPLALLALAGCPADGPDGPVEAHVRGAKAPAEPVPHTWPPAKGERYPDLELKDSAGADRRLSEFEGKVILVEPIGMDCPACQAFAGAEQKGAFGGAGVQQGMPSVEQILADQGVDPADPDFVYVQLLLYDFGRKSAPEVDKAAEWAAHFGMDERSNSVVLVGDARYINPQSYAMIPGFHLIDREFVLQAYHAGHDRSSDDAWTVLFPKLRDLLN
jgi:hypothetical protein